MSEVALPKDRRPKIGGCPRASMLLRKHCRITPYVHQADGLAAMLERFERFHSFGLLHDMGCGKTLTMLGALLALYEEGRAQTMLAVCPTSVISAWQKDAKGIHARGGVEIDVLALTHPEVARRKKALAEWLAFRQQARQTGGRPVPGIVAVNYEATWRMEPELRKAGFDLEACDESQRIKAPGAKQSRAMGRIGQAASTVATVTKDQPFITKAPYRVVMTGTPVPEGALDWYGQFRFLDPTVFGTSHANFKRKYATEIDCGTFRKVVVNTYALPELEAKVMERVHRVSKEEAVDLPEQTHNILSFDLVPKQRKIYDDLVRDSVAFLERADGSIWTPADGFDVDMGDEIVGDNVLTRMLRLQQIEGGFMQVYGKAGVVPCVTKKQNGKEVAVNPKMAVLADLMETLLDANAKLVIFHRFTHEGQAIIDLARRLSGKHRPVSHISGAVKARDRAQMVDDFQEGDAMFFVGQINACAEGITLHAAADTAFYSSPFSSAVFQQALARVHRIGQDRPVTHHHLIGAGTIAEEVYASQMRKEDAAREAVDGGWSRYIRGR